MAPTQQAICKSRAGQRNKDNSTAVWLGSFSDEVDTTDEGSGLSDAEQATEKERSLPMNIAPPPGLAPPRAFVQHPTSKGSGKGAQKSSTPHGLPASSSVEIREALRAQGNSILLQLPGDARLENNVKNKSKDKSKKDASNHWPLTQQQCASRQVQPATGRQSSDPAVEKRQYGTPKVVGAQWHTEPFGLYQEPEPMKIPLPSAWGSPKEYEQQYSAAQQHLAACGLQTWPCAQHAGYATYLHSELMALL